MRARVCVCVCVCVHHSSGFADKRMSIQLFKWPHKTSELIAPPYTYGSPHKIRNIFQATVELSLNDWCCWNFKITECNSCTRFNLLHTVAKFTQTVFRERENLPFCSLALFHFIHYSTHHSRKKHNWQTASVLVCCCLNNYEKDLRAAEQPTVLHSVHLIALKIGFTFSLHRKRNESVRVALSRHRSRAATGQSAHVIYRNALSCSQKATE